MIAILSYIWPVLHGHMFAPLILPPGCSLWRNVGVWQSFLSASFEVICDFCPWVHLCGELYLLTYICWTISGFLDWYQLDHGWWCFGCVIQSGLQVFIENFCMFRDWPVIFVVIVVSLSDFDIGVTMTLWREAGHVFSFSVLWTIFRCFGVSSFFNAWYSSAPNPSCLGFLFSCCWEMFNFCFYLSAHRRFV